MHIPVGRINDCVDMLLLLFEGREVSVELFDYCLPTAHAGADFIQLGIGPPGCHIRKNVRGGLWIKLLSAGFPSFQFWYREHLFDGAAWDAAVVATLLREINIPEGMCNEEP